MRCPVGIAAYSRPDLDGHALLLRVVLQFAEQSSLERLQILLSEGARADELVEVLAHIDLHLGQLVREFARIRILAHSLARLLINLVLLQEFLHQHLFQVALVSLRVETLHFRLVLLRVKCFAEIKHLLRHFFFPICYNFSMAILIL